ncbi:tRNA preQ1(34) S-adenosylmethionine ribosyltransferase-isomerase QueA [Microbaculum marinum]|uniref:S-adenosylmethionine:tRNA ribosyltransferase-isomerase n=1 Tax=Microbaculum marinum TaxID=1764581 RepID=A0AAW9RV64_9HYPH
MRVDLFDFELPPERIALRPVEPRDAARLLAVRPGAPAGLEDRLFCDLPGLLTPGDLLVFNDTRVIPARLGGRRIGRGDAEPKIEATLHQRVDQSRWKAFVKPAKRLQSGDVVRFGGEGRVCLLGTLDAVVESKGEGGEVVLSFSFHGPVLDEAIGQVGEMPLPPYIAARRPTDEQDLADYQTIYASREGAVAAPTAGLHFTQQLLERVKAAGIGTALVTLHVGAGTFLPVKADRTEDHRMHSEYGMVTEETAEQINAARAAGGRIVAVGTTSLRLLESAAGTDGTVAPFAEATDIFITPGYRFRAVDMLITNFHLPRSTLFMLVSAFSGLDTMKRAYAHAIEGGYRFYSYGDACLLHKAEAA